jgi:predicted ATPase
MAEIITILLKILEERARYEERLFVNRIREIELVYKMLLKAWNRELQEPVLLFWGIHGIGKTWLIKRLHDRFCFSLDDWKREGRSSFSVLIDLSEHKDDSNLQRVMAAIVRGMRSALGPVASELGLDQRVEKLLHALGQELTGLQLQDEADELVSLLGTLGDKRLVPVLLFDAVERFPKEMRN